MPKDHSTTSTKATRSGSSQAAAAAATPGRYRQMNNPQHMRLTLGRCSKAHPEAGDTTSVAAVDVLSSSESEGLNFRIIAGGPSIESLSEATAKEERVVDSDSQAAGSSESASDLLAIIERQKRQLQLKTSALARSKKEVKALKERIVELDEELEVKQSSLDQSQKNEIQYRNWWLNEIQFTKLLLNKIPNPNRDIDLVRTSQAHYVGHY
ncbi:hypothetical protein BKA70DRAFT_1441756 [Coprinopsis sp. MPI-PUGE-AT-0042]|nr:hypothetical protein BKA70DRAFT_1441756 [Coprinopsis sp. MPI-PUGE-AT-0042]